MGILPSHKQWATFLMRLRYVVIDELHTLRGIFGSQVAHVLRRLLRLCEHYGAHPTFCFASATIGNPGELASALCGLPVEADRRRRFTARREGARVLATTAARLALGRAHVGQRRDRRPPGPLRALRPSEPRVHAQPPRRRAGRRARPAPPRSRRDRRGRRRSRRTAPATCPRSGGRSNATCRAGKLLGIAATTALELGIDVGGLDAVDPQRLSRNARVDVAAGRSGRAHRPAFGGRARRRRRPARPVVRRAPARADASHARARGREPAEPVRAARPGRVRGRRAPARARRRALVRRRARRRRARARPGRPAEAARRDACTGRASARPRATSGCAADRRSSTG